MAKKKTNEALGDLPEQIKEDVFQKNYASDPATVDRFWDVIKQDVPNARQNRYTKENVWLDDLRLWACNLSDGHQYAGRANLFVPELHHQVENTVEKYLAGLFPNDNYMGVIPLKNTDEDTARDIQAAVKDQLSNRNKIENLFDIHGRQRALYGGAPLRCSWVDRSVTIFAKDVGGKNKPMNYPLFRGVKWESVDLFRFYITNEQGSMDNPGIVFEDDFVPKHVLTEAKTKRGDKTIPLYENLDEIRDIDPAFDDHRWVDIMRLEANAISTAAQNRPGHVFVTYMYLDFELIPGKRVPTQAVVANNNTVLLLRRNPFYFQRPPYLFGSYRKWPNKNFYPMSLPDRIRALTYQMTDLANQTMDSINYSLNPIAMIDPALAGDPGSFIVQPGAKWLASPDGVRFANFPDVSGAGFSAMQQVRAMISQFSDSATAMAPQLQGKARSATQASVVDREVSQDLKISTRQEEIDVMRPMCWMTHLMLQQYQKEDYEILVQGPDHGSWIAKNISPEQLIGDVDFSWYGASIAEKNAVTNQQLMNLFNLGMQASAQNPAIAKEIDLPRFFQRIVTEGFELKRPEDFLISLRQKKTVDQDLENIALAQMQDVLVNDGDDDDEHLQKIQDYLEEHKKLSDQQKLAFLRHSSRHEMAKKAKEQVKANEAKLQAMQMAMQQQQPPGGGQGQEQGGGKQVGPGNLNQMSEATNEADLMRGTRGVEPNMM